MPFLAQRNVCCLVGSSEILINVATGGSREYVFLDIGGFNLGMSMVWEGGLKMFIGSRKVEFTTKICLLSPKPPSKMGAENKERSQQVVCYKAGNGPGTLDMEERSESENLKRAPA